MAQYMWERRKGGEKVLILATWLGAPKACLRCLEAGHSTSLCPKKSTNVGGRPNPDKKIGKRVAQTGEKKGKNVLPTSSAKPQPSTSKKGNPATPATKATPASVTKPPAAVAQPSHSATASGSGSGPESRDPKVAPTPLGTEEDSSAEMDVSEEQQQPILRVTTPPPTNVADPDTPKKGKKRMAKEDLWQPTGEEIRDYIAGAKLCVKCWSVGHLCANCPEGPVDSFYPKAVLAHPEFQPFLERWREGRKKKGKTWQLEDHKVKTYIVVPPYCFVCKKSGHTSDEAECPGK